MSVWGALAGGFAGTLVLTVWRVRPCRHFMVRADESELEEALRCSLANRLPEGAEIELELRELVGWTRNEERRSIPVVGHELPRGDGRE
jgi:hypothetical protein